MNNFNDYPEIWMYHEAFLRVVMESLEVALNICNSELSEFTAAKLFDIMNQIIPTGFVLTTGYWPLYSTSKSQSLCVCGRFSLECRHHRHQNHWIDLDPIPDDYSVLFCPGRNGPVLLKPIDIVANPVTSAPVGFLVTLQLKFGYQESTAKRRRPENFFRETDITICSRYTLKCEWYPAFGSIVFQPNPYFTSFYGCHLGDFLLHARDRLKQNSHFNPGTMYVENDYMPQFTVILNGCDLPTHTFSSKLTNTKYNLAQPIPRAPTEMEIWKYHERVAKCRWNCQPDNDFDNFLKQLTSELNNNGQPPQIDAGCAFEQPKPVKKRRRKVECQQTTFSCTATFPLVENPPNIYRVPQTQTQINPNPIRGRRRKVQYQQVQTFGDTTTSAHQANSFPILRMENPCVNEAEIVAQLVELDWKWVEEVLQVTI